MIDEATRRQIEAADPGRSTWLTANAGSGKTRVLTDRVARLLLAGTAPERILCLTYTRAAAAEMQNRLLKRLGEWAMLPDDALRRELSDMGATPPRNGADGLRQARRLFAAAIEAPGGLKVQTIHAFCAAILRRFPLEAGVPVGFAELDDRSAVQLRAEIIEAMAEENAPEIADLVGLHSGHELDKFLSAVTHAAARFTSPPDAVSLWDFAGLPHPFGPDELLAEVMAPGDAPLLAELMPLLAAGSTNDTKLGQALAATDWQNPGLAAMAVLEKQLLFGSGSKNPFASKAGTIPTRAVRLGACAHLMDPLEALMCRVEIARSRRLALEFAQRSLALHRFSHQFTARYTAAKQARGWLDFDDLIARTGAMLSSASMAQWVLFRLDGGIDHILVDEAQDTSPEQWEVIERLTAEFTAGAGAREDAGGRTLFVVGDPKQSIYSFQGADIAVFAARRAGFEAGFAAIDRPMHGTALEYSFRSSPAVLTLVDHVFTGLAGEGLGGPTLHRAFNAAQPGRVDLWPAIVADPAPDDLPWDAVDPQPEAASAVVQLAEAVAAQIAGMLGTPVTDRHGRTRPLTAGDVLILVQRRSEAFHTLIRALKGAGLPVAGADRLRLAAELAVRDLRAVLAFLATPEDDLSLAAALRSPLFDIDEAQLWRLAAGRTGYLWQALREADPAGNPGLSHAQEVVSDMIGVSGHLRPHDLIARLLTRHDGRVRLLARLGAEAEDGMDELLNQALAYERTGVPTLTGFLVWLGEGEVEVRRSPGAGGEAGGGLIRVMTVHGAKGLESPVVILPDTARRKPPSRGQVLPVPGRPAVMCPPRDDRPAPVAEAVEALERRQEEERRRLLYVALTRAESWLIVAAAGETGTGIDSWHAMVAEGLDKAGAVDGMMLTTLPEIVAGGAPVRRLAFGTWPTQPPAASDRTSDGAPRDDNADRPPAAVGMPDWMARPPVPFPAPARPLAATALGGPKVVVPQGGMPPTTPAPMIQNDGRDDGEAAMLTGTRLHLLLEHLPDMPRPDWVAGAAAVLAGAEGGLPAAAEIDWLVREVDGLTQAPALASVFALRDDQRVLREVALAAPLPGLGLLSGTVDRLVIGPDRVVAIDYKSNAIVPDEPASVPAGILRQMAAYRDALRLIWPGHIVEVAVLWTRAREVMTLPDGVLDRAMAAAVAARAARTTGA